MKRQIIAIHGGGSFSTYEQYIDFLRTMPLDISRLKPRPDWKDSLQKDLGDDFEVLLPTMPNKTNAVYLEWCIMFEKILKITNDELILVGHSLGALFLAKYLSEHEINKKIISLHLVAGPFNNDGLNGEDLGRFPLQEDLSGINSQVSNIYIYHGNDDKVVPVSHAQMYAKALKTNNLKILDNYGHIKIEHFPELIQDILQG